MPLVYITPVMLTDAEALITDNRHNADYHAPWVQPFTDQDGFHAWFEAGAASVSLIARERRSGGIAGVFNISQIVLKNFCSAYLGFYGMRQFAGQGLMTEALRLVLTHAFTEIGLHRLEANIQPANLRSIALVSRLGFKKEGFSPRYLKIGGEWKDHERWAILADEPASDRPGA